MSLYEKRDFDTNYIEVIDSKTKKVVDRYPMPDVDHLRAETEEESMRGRKMKSFEEGFEEFKQKYRTSLLESPELIEKAKKMLTPEAFKIFINPITKPQFECVLALCNIISEFMLIELTDDFYVEYDNNTMVTLFIDAIGEIREGKKFDLKEYIDSICVDAKSIAKFYYDMACTTHLDENSTAEFILNKLGITDPDDMIKVVGYIAIMLINLPTTTATNDLSNVTEEDAEMMSEVAGEFKKLYEDGMKKSGYKTKGTK